ncbi:MAG: site-specific DNA-methyltransferase [Chloroflexi bacterium]|nr:site-specific DNA-methyltransferase [Chloroflexota bacterium]PWB43751.1 MAG: DNA methylase [Dehalococcoidia bacterium]
MSNTSADRYPPGSIRDAIVDFLELRDGPASLAEIYDGVRGQFPEGVSSSSVRSYLSLNQGTVFERTARGQYVLLTVYAPEARVPEPPLVYSFGRTRLFHGDAINWLRAQPDCSLQAVVTDPPYGLLEYHPEQLAKLRSGNGGVWRIPPSFDGHERSPLPRFTVLSEEDLGNLSRFFERFGRALVPKLVPGAHVLIASNPLLSHITGGALAKAGLERRGEIVRLVMTMRGGDRPKNAHNEFRDVTVMPRSMWEPWLLFRKPIEGRVSDNLRKWRTGGLRRPSDDRPFGDVIQSHPARSRERQLAPHPTLKPQSFMRKVVRAILPFGEGIVADPFAGSGSTLAAAEWLGYQSVGVELDEAYVRVAQRAIPALSSLEVEDSVIGRPGRPNPHEAS